MGNIKEWFRSHEILSAILIILLLNGSISLLLDFFGKTYEEYRSNEYSSEIAEQEFSRICGEGHVRDDNGYEVHYSKTYSNKSEAINDFMRLAYIYDNYYANGKFRHIYVLGKERIYRCCDKDRNRVAIRVIKHRRMGINWKAEYEINLFVERY